MFRNGETGDWIGTFQGHKENYGMHYLEMNCINLSTSTLLVLVHSLRFDAPLREREKSLGCVWTITWLHSNQTILGSYTDMARVRLWDVRIGTIVRTLETASSITSVEVSQDGRYSTTCDGTSVKFWDANHFGLVKQYDMPYNVYSASLEPKYGNKFIVGGEDMVHVFDFHTGEEVADVVNHELFDKYGNMKEFGMLFVTLELRTRNMLFSCSQLGSSLMRNYDLLELAMSSNTIEMVIRARKLMDSSADPITLISQFVALIVDIIAGNLRIMIHHFVGELDGGGF
ncbi:hypothetical protein ACS0TY_017626 [Phlomoides rotata]